MTQPFLATPDVFTSRLAESIRLLAGKRGGQEVANGVAVSTGQEWGFAADDIVLAGYGGGAPPTEWLEPFVRMLRRSSLDEAVLQVGGLNFAARVSRHSTVVLCSRDGDWAHLVVRGFSD